MSKHATRFQRQQPVARCGSVVVALVFAGISQSVLAVDWSKASGHDVALFLPGQMSWERTLTAAAHKGAKEIRSGETCNECHADEEVDIGASQAELTAYPGRSSVTVQVKAVLEGEQLHWQISGPTVDGKAPSVAMLLGSDALKSTAQAGCWSACHDDASDMKSDKGLELGKYLSRSRVKNTATGGGADIRPQADLDAALAAGEFLEFAEVKGSGKVERGYILDKLHEAEVENAGSMVISGDRWTAEYTRPLAAAKAGELALQKGAIYHFGVAIHDPGSEGRKHLVSLVRSLAIGSGDADVVAAPQ